MTLKECKNHLTFLARLKKIISLNINCKFILNFKQSQLLDKDIVQYLTKLQYDLNMKKRLSIVTLEHFLEKTFQKCYIPDDMSDLSFLEEIKEYSFLQYLTKRIIDFFGVFWLVLFSFPVMLICAYKIIRQSPGRIFFIQDRVGKDGKFFKCVKFRTMHENSYHNPYTEENDPRIFPFGNLMRLYRFDELPQVWNIIKNDMHMIGPRAEWSILVEEYEKRIPYYNERHLVAPGITGWAQVSYKYDSSVFDAKQKLMYDLYYIKHWSVALELKIVWLTAKTVCGKKGV